MSSSPSPKHCAVIGSPISHSLSPLLHRTAYQSLGLDNFSYDAFDVTPDTLGTFLAGLDESWVGLSVTAPDKQALLAYGEADDLARALQAGNTLIFGRDGEPNRITNTDVTGMVQALAAKGISQAQTAIIVGNGATARSSLLALSRLGVQEALICARDEARARASLEPIAEGTAQRLAFTSLAAPELPAAADLLVTTIPTNLDPALAASLVAPADTVFEVVYNCYPSHVDFAADDAGKAHLNGMDQLVFQAVDQIKLMTGHDVDPQIMLDAGHEALRERAGK